MTNITPSHGELLKEFLETNNLSQADVAHASSQAITTVWRQLNGKTKRIPASTMYAIAKLAKVKVNNLPFPN